MCRVWTAYQMWVASSGGANELTVTCVQAPGVSRLQDYTVLLRCYNIHDNVRCYGKYELLHVCKWSGQNYMNFKLHDVHCRSSSTSSSLTISINRNWKMYVMYQVVKCPGWGSSWSDFHIILVDDYGTLVIFIYLFMPCSMQSPLNCLCMSNVLCMDKLPVLIWTVDDWIQWLWLDVHQRLSLMHITCVGEYILTYNITAHTIF